MSCTPPPPWCRWVSPRISQFKFKNSKAWVTAGPLPGVSVWSLGPNDAASLSRVNSLTGRWCHQPSSGPTNPALVRWCCPGCGKLTDSAARCWHTASGGRTTVSLWDVAGLSSSDGLRGSMGWRGWSLGRRASRGSFAACWCMQRAEGDGVGLQPDGDRDGLREFAGLQGCLRSGRAL